MNAVTSDRITGDARLIMLRELAQATDARCNEAVLQYAMDVYGISRSREYVRTQLRVLEELGAVKLSEAGSVLVATLRQAGRDHVERRGVIEGVSRPADEV